MTFALARLAYSLFLRLATPMYLARLWWRGRHEPLYRQHWRQRLGWAYGKRVVPPPLPAPQARLWLHAVSLGETLAAAPLVAALRQQHPGLRLLFTHSTATGWQAGQRLMQDGDAQTWLPYDTPGAVRRFLRHHQPLAVAVVMETEVWPNLLLQARAAGLALVLANARLSPRSQAKGQRLRVLLHPALASFNTVLAQTQADAQRLADSGAQQVQVLGNLKFDLAPRPESIAQGRAWQAAAQRRVVLAAVTREGEEATLLAHWARQRAAGPLLPLLVLVPRHPQRFDEVARLVQAAGFSLARRSGWGTTPPPEAFAADVWLGDSMGEMPLYYGLAHVALLGGSFAPLGGQNLIEAAACGCPLLMGPHTYNFAQAAEQALKAGAAERWPTLAQALPRAVALCSAPERGAMAEKALAFAAHHGGAAQRMARAVSDLLPAPDTNVG